MSNKKLRNGAPICGAPRTPRARPLPGEICQLGVDLGVQQFRGIGDSVIAHP